MKCEFLPGAAEPIRLGQ